MKPGELLTLFGAQLEVFEPIVGQPTDGDITCLQEVLTSLLYPISYDGDDRNFIDSFISWTGFYCYTVKYLVYIQYNTIILTRGTNSEQSGMTQ